MGVEMVAMVWTGSILLLIAMGWLLLSSLHSKTNEKLLATSAVSVFFAAGYLWLHSAGIMNDLWIQTMPLAMVAILAVWCVAYVITQRRKGGAGH